MTLITNEIHLTNGFRESFIISTADRRLTYPLELNRKKKYESGKKLFKVEHLDSTVSYWGNTVVVNENNKVEPYFTWLPKFIHKSRETTSLMEFANKLREELNKRVPANTLIRYASGFHFAGYNEKGEPDFIHFSNCNWNCEKSAYDNLRYTYEAPASDYLNRDAMHYLGYDGNDPASLKKMSAKTIYRNGDIKIHEAAWESLDQVFHKISKFPDFAKVTKLKGKALEEYIKFKLKFIGDIYNRYADTKWVGGPFDVVVLKSRKLKI